MHGLIEQLLQLVCWNGETHWDCELRDWLSVTIAWNCGVCDLLSVTDGWNCGVCNWLTLYLQVYLLIPCSIG